jgi:hypothetical protein
MLTLVGVVAVAVGVAVIAWVVVSWSAQGVETGTITSIDAGATGTVNLEASTSYGLWVVSAYTVAPRPLPEVVGPDGRHVDMLIASHRHDNDVTDGTWEADGDEVAVHEWTFVTNEAGAYAISTQAIPFAQPSTIEVRPDDSATAADAWAALMLTAGGVAGCVVGASLAIAGAVWWRRRSSQC